MPAPYWIEPDSEDVGFPDISLALRDPDGLLAIGGDLDGKRIISAYQQGIFPWFSEGQPILWWSPDPRFVLFPEKLKISRSLKKTIRKEVFSVTLNKDFKSVIEHCSKIPRLGQDGTWITEDMKQAYIQLHESGFAHSVETWNGDNLVGGLYGIAIGDVFFGESMFSLETDASKVAFSQFIRYLQSAGFKLIDCQVYTEHLQSLGAEEISRIQFAQLLGGYCDPANKSRHLSSQTINILPD
ncbi:MAG: leucyl/phenylalanyl-tRNA--protein transferase [Gammaproteobacteria bacterium]|nr:leucyl/phenylalanyl-tRNA--protein transferase [Gammaproteobacteria bacterium]